MVIHIQHPALMFVLPVERPLKKKTNRLTYAGFSDWRRGPNSPYLPPPSVISSAVHSSVGLSWTGTDHQKLASSSVKWGWKKWKHQLLGHVRLFAIPWTVARQTPLSMEFSRQEYWSGLSFASPGIFLTQGSNHGLLHCRWILNQLSYQGSPLPLY